MADDTPSMQEDMFVAAWDAKVDAYKRSTHKCDILWQYCPDCTKPAKFIGIGYHDLVDLDFATEQDVYVRYCDKKCTICGAYKMNPGETSLLMQCNACYVREYAKEFVRKKEAKELNVRLDKLGASVHDILRDLATNKSSANADTSDGDTFTRAYETPGGFTHNFVFYK